MSFSRPIKWCHSHVDPIWPDGTFIADTDPAFHLDADPDPAFNFNADPDQIRWSTIYRP
jgi:hypothetical protein